VKFQMAQGLEKGEGGSASAAAQLGVGLAMAQQMAGMMSQAQGTAPVVGSAPPPLPGAGAAVAAIPDVLTPADVAKALAVTEADVVASLEKGELKGKKIGSAWRVTRAALDEFLKH
jgi:excisionase family DNA binding protein